MADSVSRYVLEYSHTIESAGVDWITTTAIRRPFKEPLYDVGRDLVELEASYGNDKTPWSWQGYHGSKCGGVSIGKRADGHIVQLRSDTAREAWRELMPYADNISRLDLQLTARLDVARPSFVRSQYASVKRGKSIRGRKPESAIIDSPTRGTSVYVGRRTSDVYGRCYDKGAEEKTAPLGTVVRWELELKRLMAKETAIRLNLTEGYETNAASMVAGYFRSKRIKSPGLTDILLETPRGPRRTDNERRMSYLRVVCQPMIAKLLHSKTRLEILEALGLDEEPER